MSWFLALGSWLLVLTPIKQKTPKLLTTEVLKDRDPPVGGQATSFLWLQVSGYRFQVGLVVLLLTCNLQPATWNILHPKQKSPTINDEAYGLGDPPVGGQAASFLWLQVSGFRLVW